MTDQHLPETFIRPGDSSRINVKRVALIYNPKSGAKKGEKMSKDAVQFFTKHEITVDLVPTQKKNHAEELCRTLDVIGKYDVVILLGGDGTLHEGINGWMTRNDDARKSIPLAVIPGGTGNSFVLELQNGIVDFRTSLERIVRGIVCPIDLAEVYFPTTENKIYLFNSLHWGMASKVNVKAEQLRWMGKAIRYTTAALLEIVNGEMTSAIIEIVDKDGVRKTMRNQYSFVIANNICTAAKGMKMAPDAKLNDGLMDLLLFRSDHMKDLAQVFRKFYDGTHTKLDFVDYYQVKSFLIIPLEKEEKGLEIEDQEVMEEILDIDGELKGIAPFKCTVLPRSIKVIV